MLKKPNDPLDETNIKVNVIFPTRNKNNEESTLLDISALHESYITSSVIIYFSLY